jgi:hypothetical protein
MKRGSTLVIFMAAPAAVAQQNGATRRREQHECSRVLDGILCALSWKKCVTVIRGLRRSKLKSHPP